jgi:hypothetical protein
MRRRRCAENGAAEHGALAQSMRGSLSQMLDCGGDDQTGRAETGREKSAIHDREKRERVSEKIVPRQ